MRKYGLDEQIIGWVKHWLDEEVERVAVVGLIFGWQPITNKQPKGQHWTDIIKFSSGL